MLVLPRLSPNLLDRATLNTMQGIGGSRGTYLEHAVFNFKTAGGDETSWADWVTVLDVWSGTPEEQAGAATIPCLLGRDFLSVCRLVASPMTQELYMEVL